MVEAGIAAGLVGLLAAAVLPQLHAAGARTDEDALAERLRVLRGQIELYRVQHDDTLPGVTGPLLEQLTRRTDRAGRVGEGGDHVLGPYLLGDGFPENPLAGSAAVLAGPTLPPADPADTAHGWRYCTTTGELHPQGDAEHAAW